jgi:formate dehydrogenase assembly factor FdhD
MENMGSLTYLLRTRVMLAVHAVGPGRTPADEKSRSIQAGFLGLEAISACTESARALGRASGLTATQECRVSWKIYT